LKALSGVFDLYFIGIVRSKELLIFLGIREKLFHAKHAEKLAKSA
jgi:hypothetical protein